MTTHKLINTNYTVEKILQFLYFLLGFSYVFRNVLELAPNITVFSVMLVIIYFTHVVIRKPFFYFSYLNLSFLIFLIFYPLIPNYIQMLKFGSFEYFDYLRFIEGILLLILLIQPLIVEKKLYLYILVGFVSSTCLSIFLSYEQVLFFIQNGITNKLVNVLYTEFNYVTSFYMIGISFVMSKIISGEIKGFKKAILLFFPLLCIVTALLLTMSRAGYISLLLSFIVFSYIWLKKHRKSLIKVLINSGIIIITLFFMLNFFNKIIEMMINRFNNLTNPYAGGQKDPRFDVWIISIEEFFQNPLGIGLNNIRYYTKYGIPEHNTILQFMGAYGWLSLIIFVFFIYNLFVFIRTINLKEPLDIFIIIVLISFIPFVLTLNLIAVRHFWFIVGILISRNRMNYISLKNWKINEL
jgi:O-Antigen ligase